MIEREFATTPGGVRVLLVDSVSFVREEDRDGIVVCASHGGESSGQYALERRPGLIFFNDAGVGKGRAGIRALELLEAQGIAAAAVSSESARIGDVVDHWAAGAISHANAAAQGVAAGMAVPEAIDAWAEAVNLHG